MCERSAKQKSWDVYSFPIIRRFVLFLWFTSYAEDFNKLLSIVLEAISELDPVKRKKIREKKQIEQEEINILRCQ